MKIIFSILALLLLLAAGAIGAVTIFLKQYAAYSSKNPTAHYRVKGTKVIYYFPPNGPALRRKVVLQDPDINSFESIDKRYAKDKNHAYFCGLTLLHSNPKKLEILPGGWAKDESNIYYLERLIEQNYSDLRLLGEHYIATAKGGYYRGKLISMSDGKSFEKLTPFLSKDKNNVYKKATVFSSDPRHFEILVYQSGAIITRDKKKAYFNDKIILGAEGSSFRGFGHTTYFKDNKNGFWKDQQLEGCDAESFTAINELYAFDENYVWYNGEIIPQADPSSFEIIEEGNGWSRDADRLFYYTKMASSKPTTFQFLGDQKMTQYATDGEFLFINWKALKDVNINDFQLLGNTFSGDGNRLFYKEKELKDIDAATFKILNSAYVLDEQNVWFKRVDFFKKIEGVDRSTFEVHPKKHNYAKDAQHFYLKGSKIAKLNW